MCEIASPLSCLYNMCNFACLISCSGCQECRACQGRGDPFGSSKTKSKKNSQVAVLCHHLGSHHHCCCCFSICWCNHRFLIASPFHQVYRITSFYIYTNCYFSSPRHLPSVSLSWRGVHHGTCHIPAGE